MPGYSIVRIDSTNLYRVEERGWLGWGFVRTPAGDDYLSFDSYDGACACICEEQHRRGGQYRRWRIISTWGRPCAG